ncbi:PxKF domain-containing protein [Micromonospora sp. NPDC050686]|uniref:PxKF domain-containing protein n=1 Tax=Micromonospora sp. NPDC050686 TaxID=3154631 RepID=UPI0033ED2F1C
MTNLAAAPLAVVATDRGTTGPLTTIEEYAGEAAGPQHLGDGQYQINWKTPRSYAGTCQKLRVDLGEGHQLAHPALFRFAA